MRNIVVTFLLLMSGIQTVSAKPKNITFISHRTTSDKVDIGTSGLSVGDVTANTGELLDPKTKTTMGTFAGRHIVIAVDIPGGTEVRDMIIQDTLPGGTVLSSVIATFNTGTNFPVSRQDRVIVGGTGKYNGARGIRYTDPIDGQPGDALVKLRFK